MKKGEVIFLKNDFFYVKNVNKKQKKGLN